MDMYSVASQMMHVVIMYLSVKIFLLHDKLLCTGMYMYSIIIAVHILTTCTHACISVFTVNYCVTIEQLV